MEEETTNSLQGTEQQEIQPDPENRQQNEETDERRPSIMETAQDSNWETQPYEENTVPMRAFFGHSPPQASKEMRLPRPLNPQWASRASRLATFYTWPPAMCIRKEELVDSGFAYTSCGDRVVCFSCALMLYMFDPDDDIDAEHRRYSPTCPFMKLKASQSGENSSYPYQEPANPSDLGKSKEELSHLVEQYEEKLKCKICLDKITDIIITKCGHLASCFECITALQSCPICRGPTNKVQKIYW